MIALLLAFAANVPSPEHYELRCNLSACRVASRYLDFEVRRSGRSLVVQPKAIVIPTRDRSAERLEVSQYVIVPDYCFQPSQRCHYIFGPGSDVVTWSERDDTAYRIPTRVALRQLKRARKLSFQTTIAVTDALSIVSREVAAQSFLEAVTEAVERLRKAKL